MENPGMDNPPYSNASPEQMILRDKLAVDRTLLANERTLLAYLRFGVALLIAGVSMIHFASEEGWFWAVGVVCIPLGIYTTWLGTTRYRQMNRQIVASCTKWMHAHEGPETPSSR